MAQFSFWGNYLPRVYPTYLRGTGEGFAANVGGRMLGTSFAYVTHDCRTRCRGLAIDEARLCSLRGGLVVYLVGFLLSFALPEPKSEALPE